MDEWNSIAERKIREAMAEGAFDKLTGQGQPLTLEENPYEDPSLRMAHRLLRNNGFAPAWVEEAKELEQDTNQARREFEVSGARDRFRERIAAINRRILIHNLKTPSDVFHMPLVDPGEV